MEIKYMSKSSNSSGGSISPGRLSPIQENEELSELLDDDNKDCLRDDIEVLETLLRPVFIFKIKNEC